MAQALAEATQALCAAGGSLELEELRRRLRVDTGALEALLCRGERLAVAQRGSGKRAVRVVLAVTALRLCRLSACPGVCADLHFCKFQLYGDCKIEKTGKKCRNGHSLSTQHNLGVLRTHGVDHLSYSELCQLLFQNDPWLLPEICLHYNKGDGPYGSCTFERQCIKLHLCQYFLQGDCKFGVSCKRSHDFSRPETLEKLKKLGMSPDLVRRLPNIYRNAHSIKNPGTPEAQGLVPPGHVPKGQSMSMCFFVERKDTSPAGSSSTASSEENKQICLYHVWKGCGFQDQCQYVHFHLPYRWQFRDGDTWKDLDKMELVEEAYSNPHKEGYLCTHTSHASSSHCLDFGTMMLGTSPVRRLSTASSVTKPPYFILTTDWVWYWTDQSGWQEYGKQGTEHPVATVGSPELEKAYLAYCAPGSDAQASTLKFTAGRHSYELDFKAFTQKKLSHGRVRKVCRRPKYVSPQDVKTKRACNTSLKDPRNIPNHWDLSPSALPDLGFKRIALSPSSEEYQRVQELFSQTLPSCVIQGIERVQNLSLWEVYQWQKGQMQKQRWDGKVDERQLFHGTSSALVDAICQQNFDWRVCGLHGTSYGKGSYFARDAAYSHHYCESTSQNHAMFLARVLVGEFTRGHCSFVRPPTKEGQGAIFYDSCVNSVLDPSIFVIFEKHQVYPEYLIQYRADHMPETTASASALAYTSTLGHVCVGFWGWFSS
ncbi:PREDICTED: poly [ADP-ribose] polymerase 12 [Elephantulus edwardii]|uniref:poly [ADP-ribose] polymerase 12 n=1 Tax=Elephantulus edwardii TaxID=28737 RepID=UPI0003F06A56|nr:PREDICTED: poly [ADP-ribose] polymerase 12 [Elephantulus edwardii]